MWLLKSLLQMNSNSLVNKQKQKQTKKNIYMKIGFQNWIARFSFLCHVTDIKIVWINACVLDGSSTSIICLNHIRTIMKFITIQNNEYWSSYTWLIIQRYKILWLKIYKNTTMYCIVMETSTNFIYWFSIINRLLSLCPHCSIIII